VYDVLIGHDNKGLDYRCESCDAKSYERHDFDKSLPRPEVIGTVEPESGPEKEPEVVEAASAEAANE
jgi:hypothetical protein